MDRVRPRRRDPISTTEAAEHRPPIDERVIGAGTTVRFALVVILLGVSGAMLLKPAITGGSELILCHLASGHDPQRDSLRDMVAKQLAQQEAYDDCASRLGGPEPWLHLAWPLVLAVGTTALFWLLPVWRTRRGRTVPLTAADPDGRVGRILDEAVRTAGVGQGVRVVVDPTATSVGAVVFGRTGRPILRLNGGLIVRAAAAPEQVRAVLLHELAHVRNRDITLTYVTVAAWRVFALGALLPYATWAGLELIGSLSGYTYLRYYAVTSTRALVEVGVSVALVYLSRSDVLRTREIYADLTAARWGADLSAVPPAPPGRLVGRLGGTLARLAERLRPHPRWDLRRASLSDPVELFGLRPLPMVLTGVAGMLVHAYATEMAGEYGWSGGWRPPVVALLASAPVTGVAGIALWRRTVHAILTRQPRPTGVAEGLWLGIGLAAGAWLAGPVNRWNPDEPWWLLVFPLAGLMFSVWIAQCARLWVGAWRGRSISTPMLPSLAVACSALAAWFAWWGARGHLLMTDAAAGWDLMLALLLEDFSALAEERRSELEVIAALFTELRSLDGPLVLPALTAMWVVPLLAWTVARADTGAAPAGWIGRAMPGARPAETTIEPLPKLRRLLVTATLGGLGSWLTVAGVMAWMHSWRPDAGDIMGAYVLIYWAWLLLAATVPPLVAAVLAGLSLARFRLVAALLTAQAGALVALLGMVVLGTVEGCVEPIVVVADTCPSAVFAKTTIDLLLHDILAFGGFVALLVAFGTALIDRWRSRRTPAPAPQPSMPQPSAPETSVPHPSAPETSAPEPLPADGSRSARLLVARRVVVVGLCVLAVCTVAYQAIPTPLNPSAGRAIGSADADMMSRAVPLREDEGTSRSTKALQIAAWSRTGGTELIDGYMAALFEVVRTIRDETRDQDAETIDYARIHRSCADLAGVLPRADRFFVVPDSRGNALWEQMLDHARNAVETCERIPTSRDPESVLSILQDVRDSFLAKRSLTERLNTLQDTTIR